MNKICIKHSMEFGLINISFFSKQLLTENCKTISILTQFITMKVSEQFMLKIKNMPVYFKFCISVTW